MDYGSENANGYVIILMLSNILRSHGTVISFCLLVLLHMQKSYSICFSIKIIREDHKTFMESIGWLALQNIFGDFISAVTGGAIAAVDKAVIYGAFINCGDVIARFENEGEDSFGEAVRLVFSKDNLREIYKKLKKEPGYDYVRFIRRQMETICSEYGIKGDAFIDSFVDMFKNCIYKYDKDLYDELYQGEWREEDRRNQLTIISMLHNMAEKMTDFPQKTVPLIADTHMARGQRDAEADEVLLTWKLTYMHIDGLWAAPDVRKNELLKVTGHWREERLRSPSWYVVPGDKRDTLRSYTRHEELLYVTEQAAFEELFDFAYELVWRYETGFMAYTGRLLSEIRKVWDRMGDRIACGSATSEQEACWFYIGQALLREYREDLDLGNWNTVYEALWKKRGNIAEGEAELSLERIKLLFMQMKIADTRDRLATFSCEESAVGVRLQIAGLKAECGLFAESLRDLQDLERDLLSNIRTDSNRQNHVLYQSVLAAAYFLWSFVLQAQRPFDCAKELKEIWGKSRQYQTYFDFERERRAFAGELGRSLKKMGKEEPFAIDREKRIIISVGQEFSENYDFYRLLDRVSIPLHIGYTRLVDDDESDFVKILLERYRYIGWYMLLRFGSTKTIKKVVSRKECIILNDIDEENLKRAFNYVFDAVNGNIGSMGTTNRNQGESAYGHILSNGLEILGRLASTVNVVGQKKLIGLMCRLIDTDVVKEYRVLDGWIRQVMKVTEDRAKAAMLNELLICSAKERTHIEGESTIDPFDVFFCFTQAAHWYRSADIEPDIIDDMIDRASSSEEEKKHVVPRLGQIAEWGLLTAEQSEKFAALLWAGIDEEILLPYKDDYFPDVFLRWPCPRQINIADRIKRRLLAPENFQGIKEKLLSSMTFGDSVFLRDIQHMNNRESGFWKTDEIELLMKGFLDCWQDVREKYAEDRHPNLHEEEFRARAKSLLRAMSSFDRNQVRQISMPILQDMERMVAEMDDYGLETIELSAMIGPEDRLDQVVEEVIAGLRSADKEKTDASAYAAENLLLDCYHAPAVGNILNELLLLCQYGKRPGLNICLAIVQDLLYFRNDVKLSVDSLNKLNEILESIDKLTCYPDHMEKNEKEIKEIIRIRISCAKLAYQLYLYRQRNPTDRLPAVLVWKDICRGKRSKTEFTEVKRCWCE